MNQPGTLFNMGEVSTSDTFPAGQYQVQAIDFEMKETKAGGQMLKGVFEITAGPHQGRKLFENYNLVNQNPAAVEMGQRNLKRYLVAVGVPDNAAVTMPLIVESCGREFLATVKVRVDKSGEYDDENVISKYAPLTSAGATPTPAAAPVDPQAAPAASPSAQGQAPNPWD